MHLPFLAAKQNHCIVFGTSSASLEGGAVCICEIGRESTPEPMHAVLQSAIFCSFTSFLCPLVCYLHGSLLPQQILPQTWSNPSTAFERTKAAVQQSLQRIGFPSIDLMLLHAPGPSEGRAEAWRALEEAHKQVRLPAGVGHQQFVNAHHW